MSSEEGPVAWLRTQVEARKAAAKLAAREGGTWTQDDPERYPGSIESLGGKVVYDEGSPDERQAAHIALNDPQDTIARCEAELAILDLHQPVAEGGSGWLECQECGPNNDASGILAIPGQGETFWPCATVRLLAGGYRHRPGFPADFAGVHAG